jgi:hypothetical protein
MNLSRLSPLLGAARPCVDCAEPRARWINREETNTPPRCAACLLGGTGGVLALYSALALDRAQILRGGGHDVPTTDDGLRERCVTDASFADRFLSFLALDARFSARAAILPSDSINERPLP